MAKEPEYGETTATREQATAAPMPQEPSPQEPEEMVQAAAGQTEETQGQPAGALPPEDQRGFVVRNPYMLLPPTVNLTPRRKTQPERNHDAGMLWEVLAEDSSASPLTRMVARSLLGRE